MSLIELIEPTGGLGRLILRGDQSFFESIRTEVAKACLQSKQQRGIRDQGELRVFFKYGRLYGKSRVRHALRMLVWHIPYPRLNEFDNLSWLRRNGFDAPRPLAAGVYVRTKLPFFQFLFTQEISGARTLREVLESGTSGEREVALAALGPEIARLHGRGFVHRDLYPRNLLFTGLDAEPCIHFVDAWRGGVRPGLRGPTYDLACLMLSGADLLSFDEQRALLDAYFSERERLKKPLNRERALRSVAKQREELALRLMRRPVEIPPTPSIEWDPRWLFGARPDGGTAGGAA